MITIQQAYDYPTTSTCPKIQITSTVVISKKHKPEGGGGTPLSPDPPLPLVCPQALGSPPGTGTGLPPGMGMGSPPGMGTGLPQAWAWDHHQTRAWVHPQTWAWAYQLL